MSDKQTAVEYFARQISEILGPLETDPMKDLLILDVFNKAKQMERGQIESAYDNGWFVGLHDGVALKPVKIKDGSKFYEQTYLTTSTDSINN